MSAALVLALAGAGGGLFAVALREIARASPALAGYTESALAALALAGREGRAPTDDERRRLGVLATLAITALTILFFGLTPMALLAGLGPAAATRLLGRRRRLYRVGFERRIPALASGLADALAAGSSLRTALLDVGPTLDGPALPELARVSADLQLGESPGEALAAMQRRLESEPVAAFVAAALSQQRSGGDLAALMRRHAEAATARRRALAAARSATAQARLTGGMVAVMPVGAGVLVEMASPGFLGSLVAEPAAAALVAAALGLQLAGYLAIQRLGRVRG